MKRFSKLIGFIVVFIVMMVTMRTASFAEVNKYTDNLIPTMTSNTSPSGTASASTEWTDGRCTHYAWRAFDHSAKSWLDCWATSNNVSNSWLEYDFNDAKCITKYTLVSRVGFDINELPSNWTFQAFNEETHKWVVLDTHTNVTSWVVGVKKEFVFDNTNSYNKYRIYITQNVNNNGAFAVIGELEMMETLSAPTNFTVLNDIGKVDLKWDAVEGVTSYNIYRSETSAAGHIKIGSTTSGAITTYTDATAQNGTSYYYVVTAVNDSGESVNSNEVSATPQVINQLKLVLEVNEGKQLSVSEELSDNSEMEWTSSNSTIATVDENGKVKALKSGNTIITCTSKDKSYTESINVLVVDLQYQLAVDLNVGDKCRLTVDDLANATNVTWTAYDSTIATVTAKGRVTAISDGLTYVVASDKDGKEIGRIYIRVRK